MFIFKNTLYLNFFKYLQCTVLYLYTVFCCAERSEIGYSFFQMFLHNETASAYTVKCMLYFYLDFYT